MEGCPTAEKREIRLRTIHAVLLDVLRIFIVEVKFVVSLLEGVPGWAVEVGTLKRQR